jgi:hypothetical protein
MTVYDLFDIVALSIGKRRNVGGVTSSLSAHKLLETFETWSGFNVPWYTITYSPRLGE